MKVGLRFTVTCGLLVTFAVGCTCMQKPWGTGAIGGGIGGAIAGGIATGAASNNSGAFNVGNDNEDKAVAIVSGAIAGGAIGALLGHCLWDAAAQQPPAPPPPPAPAPPVQKKIVLRGVNFDFDKANIRADAAPILKEAASILKENASIKVDVEGHTDGKGSDAYNLKLSLRRAAAVKAFLVHEGIADGRLSTRGFGKSQPVASNDTDDGRAQNRRVELKVSE